MLYLQVLEEEQNKILNAATESFKSESTIPSVDSLDAFSHSSQVELLMARASDWWSQYIRHNPNVLTSVFYDRRQVRGQILCGTRDNLEQKR